MDDNFLWQPRPTYSESERLKMRYKVTTIDEKVVESDFAIDDVRYGRKESMSQHREWHWMNGGMISNGELDRRTDPAYSDVDGILYSNDNLEEMTDPGSI